MFIVGILSWWYGAGWRARVLMVRERLAGTMDYFSIALLLRTLFSPFRQISAGRVDGPLGLRWRAFVDRLISRVIGAVVRMLTILTGVIVISIVAMIGVMTIVLWAVVPVLPLAGIVLTVTGWVPSWT